MRKSIEIVIRDFLVRGTVHEPPAGALPSAPGFEGLGVVILHPGFLPRSGQGQLAVNLADSLAEMGVRTIRIDQPGLGDSEGPLAEDSISFAKSVEEGGYADMACECLNQLKAEFNIQKLIIGGHCGGAMTAFFTVASNLTHWPAGIFALDPIFTLAGETLAPSKIPLLSRTRASLHMRLNLLSAEIRSTLLKTTIGEHLQRFAQNMRQKHPHITFKDHTQPDIKTQSAHKHLPPQANAKLLKCVARILKSEVRLLHITAADPRHKTNFNYLEYLIPGGSPRLTCSVIEGADHGFLAGAGKSKVINTVKDWITREFRNDPSAMHG